MATKPKQSTIIATEFSVVNTHATIAVTSIRKVLDRARLLKNRSNLAVMSYEDDAKLSAAMMFLERLAEDTEMHHAQEAIDLELID